MISVLLIGSSYSQGVKHDVSLIARKSESSYKGETKTNGKQESTVARAHEESSKWDPITWFTLVLAIANVLLWWTTRHLVREAQVASGIAKQSADAAKESADAAVIASMPILSPFVVNLARLHPLGLPPAPEITFTAHVPFVFENFGKTPGHIREVRADLFLCELDTFPSVDFDKLTHREYEPIVPGDSRYQTAALMGVAECENRVTMTRAELEELLAEAATGKYRRFALIGQVIYDDFFQTRHTRRFCVKLRRMGVDNMFQLVRGGPTYNRITRATTKVG